MSTIKNKIIDIFNQCQEGKSKHRYLFTELIDIYEQTDVLEEFLVPIINCIKICFLEDENSPYVKNVIKFAITFIIAICHLDETRKNNISVENTIKCRSIILKFILDCCEQPSTLIRRRICQFLAKLLKKIHKDASLYVFHDVRDVILKLLKDKSSNIRLNAVKALERFQGDDNKCPVIKAYFYHLDHDPNVKVRRTILNKIVINVNDNVMISVLLKRTRDSSEYVRFAAYRAVSNLPVLKLTISERITLLSNGLNDIHPKVREGVRKILLPAWFSYLKNDYIALLTVVNICDSYGAIKRALWELFETQSKTEIINQCRSFLNDQNIIPDDEINREKSFFWSSVISFFTGNRITTKLIDAERLFPQLTVLCSYIRKSYLEQNQTNNGSQNERLFVLNELIILCKNCWKYFAADEAGKKNLTNLLIDLIKSNCITLFTLRLVIRLYFNVDNSVLRIIGCVLHIWLPRLSESEVTLIINAANVEETVLIDMSHFSEQDPTNIKKCLTIVQEIVQSKQIQTVAPILRSLLRTFILPIYMLCNAEISIQALEIMGLFCLRDIELARKNFLLFCVAVSNEQTCISALKVVFDLLCHYGPNKFQNEDVDLHKMLNCVNNYYVGKSNNAVSDLAIMDGSEISSTVKCGKEEKEDEDVRERAAKMNIIKMLMNLFEDSSEKIRVAAVKGICQLILLNLLSSADLISKLILIWFHPKNCESVEIQRFLAIFFSLYPRVILRSQRVLKDAFLPTLLTAFRAPLHSPLSKINQISLAKFLVALINTKFRGQSCDPVNYHDELAMLICEEMLKNVYYSAERQLLLKVLSHLEVSFDDSEYISTINSAISKLENRFLRYKDKPCLKYIKKIQINLQNVRKNYGHENEKDKYNYDVDGKISKSVSPDYLKLIQSDEWRDKYSIKFIGILRSDGNSSSENNDSDIQDEDDDTETDSEQSSSFL